MVKKNGELEKSIREKTVVIDILKRSLQAVRKSFTESTDEELDRGQHFFGEQTTVQRVYLRQLVHTHEHMGPNDRLRKVYGHDASLAGLETGSAIELGLARLT